MLEEKTRTEKATEPAKRWFNWWFSHGDGDAGPWREGSDDQSNPQHDPTPYPSKDAAETIANVQVEKMRVDQGPWLLTYLGAYPEGQKP